MVIVNTYVYKASLLLLYIPYYNYSAHIALMITVYIINFSSWSPQTICEHIMCACLYHTLHTPVINCWNTLLTIILCVSQLKDTMQMFVYMILCICVYTWLSVATCVVLLDFLTDCILNIRSYLKSRSCSWRLIIQIMKMIYLNR